MAILVDGSYLLHRCAAWSIREDRVSMPHYVCGFLKSLKSTLKKYDTGDSVVVVAWDFGVPDFRKRVFDDYKRRRSNSPRSFPAGDPDFSSRTRKISSEEDKPVKDSRKESDDDTKLANFHFTKKVLHGVVLPSLGVPSIMVQSVEADDIIYLLSRYSECEVVVVSTDRDLFQTLEGDRVVISNHLGETTEKEVIYRHKLSKENWRYELVLKKALTGDKSDNVPRILSGRNLDFVFKHIREVAALYPDVKAVVGKIESLGLSGVGEDFPENFRRNCVVVDLEYPHREEKEYMSRILGGVKISCGVLSSSGLQDRYFCCRDLILNSARESSVKISDEEISKSMEIFYEIEGSLETSKEFLYKILEKYEKGNHRDALSEGGRK